VRKTELFGFPNIKELFLKRLNDLNLYRAIGVLQGSVMALLH